MALNKQIHIYSVDTSAFYKKRERKIHNKLNKLYISKKLMSKVRTKIENGKIIDEEFVNKFNNCWSMLNNSIDFYKSKLCKMLNKNTHMRNLDRRYLTSKNIISVFDSSLTRTIGINEGCLNTDLFIVQTYFFDVIEDIILDGFMFNNEKYVCFTASAGQIRTKKTVFIKERVLLEHQKTLMCGLTIDKINEFGGVNINKYLAYLALCNSATDKWINFDIDRCIVVDDFETLVFGKVDFIDDTDYSIHRQDMYVPIVHTDGCGIILPKLSDKNFMVRLPWVKGLLSPFQFDEFSLNKIVIDIYGKEWDILKDNIEIIFTKSQFKMYKYYSSWNEYKNYFKLYNCQAGICNLEEDELRNATINYQMIQTLVDMKDDELKRVARNTIKDIENIGTDIRTMFKVLGATKSNERKNYFQQAVLLYPPILSDVYSKEILKLTKKSLVKEARAAKLEVNGKYTFIIPDLYAFCDYLFNKNKNPIGLLKDGEIYCNLYKKYDKLACLRSPHLYREWAIKKNVVDDFREKWFITKGVYTSCHDLISKMLQFDVDGDKSLVCADKTLISVAERNMKGIVPLYYNMRKAQAEKITAHSIYNGLKMAYTGGNIGMISNDITKIWNSSNINLDIVKLLCMENNFTIDYAKTLFKPTRPNEKKKMITDYTKNKVPHFFIYAKDKEKDKVEPINNSVVNRLHTIIKNPRLNFNCKDIGKFNYVNLMNNVNTANNEKIIELYEKLDCKSKVIIQFTEDDEAKKTLYVYKEIRDKLLEIEPNPYIVTDILIRYLYSKKKADSKTTLWYCFGDIIIENINNNINYEIKDCEKCSKIIFTSNNKQKYCTKCAKVINIQKTIENRKNKKLFEIEKPQDH